MELPSDIRGLIDRLQQEIAELRAENASFRLENAALRQDNADLRRRLGLDSSNSGKPPSSDGLGKKTREARVAGSLRGLMGSDKKKSGGQIGHKGDTLRPVEKPDKTVAHHAERCAHCAAALTAAMRVDLERRQVFDLPEPRLEVTEHQAGVYRCACCQGTTRAAFPEGVDAHVQYGPRVKATAIYLNVQQLIPEDRVSEILCDLLGAGRLCPASLATWCARKAEDLGAVMARIGALIAKAPVRHLDETGFRVAGKLHWLHTASTPALTAYRVTQTRGDVPGDLEGGVIVHDHFKSYFNLPGLDHALCNAHHLRELKALIEIEKEPWAKRMFRLLLKALKAVRRALAKGRQALLPRTFRRIARLYAAIVTRGLEYHEAMPPLARKSAKARGRSPRRVGHNLLIRFRDHMGDVLRFLYDFAVPFTNNLAEQDIRMTKVKMKISGGFRTLHGATVFADIRSVLSTARKHGWSLLDTLRATPAELLAAMPP